jgi:hypothetical protein
LALLAACEDSRLIRPVAARSRLPSESFAGSIPAASTLGRLQRLPAAGVQRAIPPLRWDLADRIAEAP